MLRCLTSRITRAGRLRVEPELAAQVVWAAVYGVTSMLSSRPDFGWHDALKDTVREAVISALTLPERKDESGEPMGSSQMASVEALRLLGILQTDDTGEDHEDLLEGFSEAEVALLKEWLGRIAARTARARQNDQKEELWVVH